MRIIFEPSPVRRHGQLAAFAQRDESSFAFQRQRCAKNEAKRVDACHSFELKRGHTLSEIVDKRGKGTVVRK